MKKHFLINLFILSIFYVLMITFKEKLLSLPFYAYILPFLYFLYFPIRTIIPVLNKKLPSGKFLKKNYLESSFTLPKKFYRSQSIKAIISMLLWLLGMTIIGLLHYYQLIEDIHIYLLVFAFHMFDTICTDVFCPFQLLIFKNDCCMDCRINNWDNFFKYSILIFVPNPFTITLFIAGALSLLTWEFTYIKHKERFYPKTNNYLKCTNCTQEVCKRKHQT